VDRLPFSTLERKVYDSIYISAKKRYDTLSAQGLVGKNYTHILAMLMRLRRAVLHPSLVLEKDADDSDEAPDTLEDEASMSMEEMLQKIRGDQKEGPLGGFAKDVLDKLKLREDQECPVCLSINDVNVVIPNCLHIWYVFFGRFVRLIYFVLPVAKTVR
jgi:DNA repair protein RAD5